MSEYRLTELDFPWMKQYRADNPMPLPKGVSAVIPNPEGDGYRHVSPEEYAKVLTGLTRSTMTLEENRLYHEQKARADSLKQPYFATESRDQGER